MVRKRFDAMRADPKIQYCFIFENRGEAVGVTMPHPHGQIYGYPFVPKKLRLETASAKEYQETHNKCIFCDMLDHELADGRRIIFRNEHFTVFLPFFTEYPYGVYLFSNRHCKYITDFTREERFSLAVTLKQTVMMLDSLFDYTFPYMMCMHNAPINCTEAATDFHFHIEFFPQCDLQIK